MTNKYTEAHLRKNLVKQELNSTTLFYSIAKKDGQNISFLSNERLLIYDSTPKILYYINDFKNTPFELNIPMPKNKLQAPLVYSTYKNPPNTAALQVRYVGKNQKDESVTIEWNFTFDNQLLAKQWMALFEEEKNKLVSKAVGEPNAGFVHDALFTGINNSLQQSQPNEPVRETILKLDQQKIKPIPQQENPPNINKSRINDPNISRSKIVDSDINASISRTKIIDSNNRNQPNASKSKISQPNKSRLDPNNQAFIKSQKQRSNINESMVLLDNSVLRSNNNNKAEDSRLRNTSTFKDSSSQGDWNLKFLKQPYEGTLLEFQQAALKAFKAIWQRDQSVFSSDPKRVYQSHGLRVVVSNIFTRQAAQLKKQFRNYHFILESCKNKMILNVPLACLIEWQGVVGLVKAGFPSQARELTLSKALPDMGDVERYTRVSNNILEKAILLDLTEAYGHNGENSLIFVDNLIEYLPIHVDQQYLNTTLRPEYVLDNVGQLIPGGEVRPVNKQEYKLLSSACQPLNACIKQLAQNLSNQQSLWVHALQLKELFHSSGVNLKCLPRVYNEVQNKQAKRYLHTVMAAKVAKDQINETLAEAREQSKMCDFREIVESLVRVFVEGNNSTSSQFWKNLSLSFKKKYSMPINNSEIIGGFFLNSLVHLLNLDCNWNKLNKNKRIFKQEGIILPGFLIELQPKIKSYYRFTTEFVQKIRYASKEQKKELDICNQIIKELQLQHNGIPAEYAFNNNQQMVLEYLSYYFPPPSLDPTTTLKNIPIYGSLLQEPPSSSSLRITKSYLNWCIKKDKSEEFKINIQLAMKSADYWLDENHLYHCELFQLLSDFYSAIGNGEESINFMKESLSKCIRICGAQSKQAGVKYYQLGERQLKVGRKRQALQNFSKAKINMQSHQSQSLSYPQLLMRLSSLHLNNGNIQNCIEGAMQAIKQFEEYDRRTGTLGFMTEGYKIKSFEVLSRAYEISGKKVELKQMASICAKKFNSTKSQWTYEQMLRICLAAIIVKNPIQKCELFSSWISSLIVEEGELNASDCLKELKVLSQKTAVMQKFIVRFDQLQRVIGQFTSKKGSSQDAKQFAKISKLLVGVVGQDYVDGLVQQKHYE